EAGANGVAGDGRVSDSLESLGGLPRELAGCRFGSRGGRRWGGFGNNSARVGTRDDGSRLRPGSLRLGLRLCGGGTADQGSERDREKSSHLLKRSLAVGRPGLGKVTGQNTGY